MKPAEELNLKVFLTACVTFFAAMKTISEKHNECCMTFSHLCKCKPSTISCVTLTFTK